MTSLQNILIEKLSCLDNVVFAYLFGSYAKKEQTHTSDVDIAVFLQNTDLDAQLQLNYELSKFLKKDVDLVMLNNVKNLFLLESIFKDGQVLKDGETRIDFELVKEHDILDYKAFKKAIDAA
jgi:predicted nucleotidyltransferase